MAPQGCHAGDALEMDWLAGVVGIELRNPSAIHVFEML